MKNRIPWIAAAVVALLLAGFGVTKIVSGGSDRSRPTSSASGLKATQTQQAIAQKNDNPLGTNGGGGPSAKPSRSFNPNGPCVGHVAYSRLAGEPVSEQYIRAATNLQRQWGPQCIFLHPGASCRVGWNAAYSVPVGDAYLLFQGWASGQKKPFGELTIGPLAGNNTLHDISFQIAIPKAKEVAFRLVLENDKRVPVAISDSYVYPVDCVPRTK
ncbi:MAG: hypothetical protein NVSMB57_10450 [Actinomycetota bacterium]